MSTADDQKTCEELAEEEYCERHECHVSFCKQPNNQQLEDQFWPDSRSRQLEAADLLFLQKLCPGLQTNGAEEKCSCDDGSGGASDGCCCKLHRTGCDDPEKCPNRTIGIDLVAVLRAVVKVMGMATLPVAGLIEPTWENPTWGIPDGAVLTYDENAMPDNRNWDPCKPQARGAFVPVVPE